MFQKAIKKSFALLLSLTLALTLMVPAVFAEESPSVQGDVLVESVTIQNRVDRLLEGETAQLTSEVLPEDATNKNVTWSSSDESVLTVSQDGLVRAVGAGTATIKASAQTEDMIFDTCKIKVVAKPIFKTDKDTYEPNETILVTVQTDYNVASVILKDEAGNEINRIHVQSSINGDYKEWNIKVSMAEAGDHTISVLAKTTGDYEEIAKLPVTIAGDSGESSEPDPSKPESSSTPEASEPESSTPDESNPDSSSSSSSASSSSSGTAAGTTSKPSSSSSSHSSSSKNPSTGESTPLFAVLGLAVVAGATMVVIKKREDK
ncbi:Kappa-carrageenase precursor [Eubacteriaceae bacterium CHKCI005]|nr:Kappa-carrageenase precursor [Eubacteriaceae bacterium CHKCI005]